MNTITFALGKGRLAEETFALLAKLGIVFPEYNAKSRKLMFTSRDGSIQVVLVKATDVDIYVANGATDMGVVGKDTLMESHADVYEMMDLGFGKCRFAVAMPKDKQINPNKKLVVATKYPNVAKEYYSSKGISIELIKLNGSVELAPIVGMSDVIVDIVETGFTLKAHNLHVIEEICPVSARLIVNKASLRTKSQEIGNLIEKIRGEICAYSK